nr:hypothetical protein [Streptomyces albus]
MRGVQAVYARQSGCPADLAVATVDFEPWKEGITFEVAADLEILGWDPRGTLGRADLAAFRTAFDAGIREELAEQDLVTTVAVAVVLRGMRVHEIDSHAQAFRAAGRLAVRHALALAYGRPERRHASARTARGQLRRRRR